jgi:hypothetical protein
LLVERIDVDPLHDPVDPPARARIVRGDAQHQRGVEGVVLGVEQVAERQLGVVTVEGVGR